MRRRELALLLLASAACRRTVPHDDAGDASPDPSAPAVTCGPLECHQFAGAAEAFDVVLANDVQALAVGEVHAPKGATVPSAAERFRTELLPRLRGRASDLLLELMAPPTGCTATTAEVREKHAPVHAQQAATDQGDYVALGDAARAMGIVPDLLRPTCTDLELLARSDDPIEASLVLTATLSLAQGSRLVARDRASATDRSKLVVLYGGAFHNDLAPSEAFAPFSYAPALDAQTHQHLWSLTLIVPEFIGDSPTWRAMPFYAAYDRARLGAKTTLYRTGERSFVLVFAETR